MGTGSAKEPGLLGPLFKLLITPDLPPKDGAQFCAGIIKGFGNFRRRRY